jgi:hypothetical protein
VGGRSVVVMLLMRFCRMSVGNPIGRSRFVVVSLVVVVRMLDRMDEAV